jgi:heme-degrading monooxygenase HmoA
LFIVIWEFVVKVGSASDFERHYSGRGTWAQLFQRDPAFHQTILLRDPKQERRYLTVDMWRDESSYHAFKEREHDRYLELDKQFEAFTEEERLIGSFEVVA